jgi:hypothetical protein
MVAVKRPASVVIEEPRGFTEPDRAVTPAPAFRWFCPEPFGYHPDVTECSQRWLPVLPHDAPPGPAPRMRGPYDEPARQRIEPVTVSARARIPAPRMTPPAQLVRGGPAPLMAASTAR